MHDICWFETLKSFSSFVTPIVILVLGILVLRRIESIKAAVLRQSDFQSKWGDQFFDSCQEFLRALEREVAVLVCVSSLPNLQEHDGLGLELQKEISRLHPKISELELRMRRCLVFAPTVGSEVTDAAKACFNLLNTITANLKARKQFNVDEIIERMNTFNIAARQAHAELLDLHLEKTKSRECIRKA